MAGARCRNLILILGDQLDARICEPARRRSRARRRADGRSDGGGDATSATTRRRSPSCFPPCATSRTNCEERGWRVDYRKLDDPENAGSLAGEVRSAVERMRPSASSSLDPGEWRVLRRAARAGGGRCPCRSTSSPDDRFIASTRDFASWAEGRKQLRMEYFYRDMRRKTGLLMDGDEPVGGAVELRRRRTASLPKPDLLACRSPCAFAPDAITREVLDLVRARFADHFGDLEPFWFAVTRADARRALDHFIEEALPRFGDYPGRDAGGRAVSLSLRHLALSQLRAARSARSLPRGRGRLSRSGHAPLNAVEGFIRQIIGWREYVRGIYWLKMPGYADAELLRRDAPAARLLLDRRDAHGLHARGDRPDQATRPTRITSSG